jgi:uncharacterized membrane protein YphA (DoxX/SURF4 family)
MAASSGKADWGLLILRVWFGGNLFIKHGWEKLANFSQLAQHFPDPIHIGPWFISSSILEKRGAMESWWFSIWAAS